MLLRGVPKILYCYYIFRSGLHQTTKGGYCMHLQGYELSLYSSCNNIFCLAPSSITDLFPSNLSIPCHHVFVITVQDDLSACRTIRLTLDGYEYLNSRGKRISSIPVFKKRYHSRVLSVGCVRRRKLPPRVHVYEGLPGCSSSSRIGSCLEYVSRLDIISS